MNFGRELWALYLDRHLRVDGPPALDRLQGEALAKLVWPMTKVLAPRHQLLLSVVADRAFDEATDQALRELALTGDFRCWEPLEAGVWKLLECRWGWAITGIMLEAAAETKFFIPVPRDAPQDLRSKAAILYALGTPGREFPPEWPAEFRGAADEAFRATLPTWLQ